MKHIFKALLIGAIALLSINAYGQSNSNKSDWHEVQTVVLPSDVTIHEGVTRNGNAKYWIEVGDVKVTISPSNVAKFRKGEVSLELVKWQNKETKKLRYTTRQVKGSLPSKDIDLSSLWR